MNWTSDLPLLQPDQMVTVAGLPWPSVIAVFSGGALLQQVAVRLVASLLVASCSLGSEGKWEAGSQAGQEIKASQILRHVM